MSRSSRANRLPGSDELFRSTADVAELAPAIRAVESAVDADQHELADLTEPGQRRASGRERHDEKITVYVSADELLDLEQVRLTLRRDHGLKVDRGRIVRAALADAFADLEEAGSAARLVERLRST